MTQHDAANDPLARSLLEGRTPGMASVTEFGAVALPPLHSPLPRTDSTAAFQAALDSSATLIAIPPGYYKLSGPLLIPPGSGKWMLGLGGLKSAVLVLEESWSGGPTDALISYARPPQPPGSREVRNESGCIIENLWLMGQGRAAHGVRLESVAYPLLRNVAIDNFDGAGLLIDKCQDGTFSNVSITHCGRTAGDPSVNADTTFAALHMISNIPDDHCNMLRFTDCQIENNRVSPYVWMKDRGAIAIWFDRIHAEIASTDPLPQRDFLVSEGGDLSFNGIASVNFREGFILNHGGVTRFSDCRDVGSIRCTAGEGYLQMSNVRCSGPLTIDELFGPSQILNCNFDEVTIRKPQGGPTRFLACTMDGVTITGAGRRTGIGGQGVHFLGCTLGSYAINEGAVDQWLVNSVLARQGGLHVSPECTRPRIEGVQGD